MNGYDFDYAEWNSKAIPFHLPGWQIRLLLMAVREIQKRNVWRKTTLASCEWPARAQPALRLHHGWIHKPCLLTNPSLCSATIVLGLTLSKEKIPLEKEQCKSFPSPASKKYMWGDHPCQLSPIHWGFNSSPSVHRVHAWSTAQVQCDIQYKTDDPQKS